MNTTNILLGTTSLLLVVAFALSFGGFSKKRDSDESKELREKILADLEAEDRRAEEMRLQHLRSTTVYTPPPVIPPLPVATNDATVVTEIPQETKDLIEKLQQEKLELQEQADESAAAAQLAERETEAMLQDKSQVQQMNEKRGFLVRNAMEMGRVTEASKDYGQVFFRPANNASATFQPGRILSVRRNDGIVGDIEVDRLEGNLYVASMRPHGYSPDGLPDVKPGDQIIIKLSDEE